MKNYTPSTLQPHTKTPSEGSIQFGKLVMQLKRLERRPHTFGDAGTLTPSELHTIDAIGIEGNIPMNELAAKLGVTKGAISQIIVKLEKKSLVRRSTTPHDSRINCLDLTEKGKEAYWAHFALHLDFYEQLGASLEPHELEVFERAISKLNSFLQKLHS